MRDLGVDQDGLKILRKRIAKLNNRSRRGVETLFRLASRNQYTLTTMVDRKSNILISINAILLSIIIGTVIVQLEQNPYLIIPVSLILLTNLTSIVYAVIATRPPKRHATPESPGDHHYKNNLLFYGDYSTISEEEYIQGMNHLIDHGDELYDAISRDVYYTGRTLQRKFGFLRTSFNVFMFGLILSVVAFVLCNLFLKEHAGLL
jgi:hypothetical protein